jgi:hypothetical protein
MNHCMLLRFTTTVVSLLVLHVVMRQVTVIEVESAGDDRLLPASLPNRLRSSLATTVDLTGLI